MDGVVPSQQILALAKAGKIKVSEIEKHLQPNSLDLPLGVKCWRLRGARLPRAKETVMDVVNELKIDELDLSKSAIFERHAVYIAELDCSVSMPAELYGETDAKSSTGRIDVQVRLLTDFNERYDFVPPSYQGKLYVFISSNSFLVRARAGIALNQIRFVRGNPVLSDSDSHELAATQGLLYVDAKPLSYKDIAVRGGVIMRLDLKRSVAAYRAKFSNAVVDLSRLDNPANLFWEPIPGPLESLTLERNHFYIMSTLEAIRVPPTHCGWIPPFRPEFGEFRSHYAGFYDSGFGWGEKGELHGATTTLEVRSHDNSLTLLHDTPVAPVLFAKMLDKPDRIYGVHVKSNYQSRDKTQQGPKLAKYFS